METRANVRHRYPIGTMGAFAGAEIACNEIGGGTGRVPQALGVSRPIQGVSSQAISRISRPRRTGLIWWAVLGAGCPGLFCPSRHNRVPRPSRLCFPRRAGYECSAPHIFCSRTPLSLRASPRQSGTGPFNRSFAALKRRSSTLKRAMTVALR